MRRIRALLLCDRLDVAGGVERFVCQLAGEAAAAGLDVAVGTVATPRTALRYPLPEAVRVLQGGDALPEGEGAWALLKKQWATGRALARLVRAEQPDVVLLNGLTTAASALLVLSVTAPRLLARCIACDHNHFHARSRLWQRLRARFYPRLGAVVSLTQADAARFAALNPRTVVIANASALRGTAVPAAVGDERAAPVVLAVGRHAAQKGFDRLLAAWSQLQSAWPADRPAPRLRIAGDGPLTAELRAQAQALGVASTVTWVAPTGAIRAEYEAAALFVLPSRYEGMPLALLEAQALGVPAVAFDCPTGPAEVIGAAPETGLVVPNGDVPALAAALRTLLLDAPRRQRMGEAALARSRSHFSPEGHRDAWLALLRRVALQQAYPAA